VGAVSNAAAVECALTMGVVCTNTFPGTGLLWTNAANNSSDGSSWTQPQNLFSAWSSLTTTAASNVGTATGTGAAAGGAAIWRTGGSSPADAMTTAVISMSNGWASTSNRFGIITNKPATTANTCYRADLYFVSGKTSYYGLFITKFVAGAQTVLLQPSATVTGVQGSTSKWVLQLRSTRIDGGASLLLQARAWKGTNPATPPSGADWVQSGLVSGTDYVSAAVIDSSSPLAAGRGGLLAIGFGANPATYTAEQFEFRSMSATSNSATATGTATITNTRQRVATLLANATGTASSVLSRARVISQTAIATGTASLTNNVALILSAVSTTTSSISKLVSIVRSSIATGTATGSAQKLLSQPVKTLQLACRSTIKLVIDSKVALRVRSTMKLPKE